MSSSPTAKSLGSARNFAATASTTASHNASCGDTSDSLLGVRGESGPGVGGGSTPGPRAEPSHGGEARPCPGTYANTNLRTIPWPAPTGHRSATTAAGVGVGVDRPDVVGHLKSIGKPSKDPAESP